MYHIMSLTAEEMNVGLILSYILLFFNFFIKNQITYILQSIDNNFCQS